MALTTHHHLAPRLRKEYSYTSTPPSIFVACSRVTLTFTLLCKLTLKSTATLGHVGVIWGEHKVWGVYTMEEFFVEISYNKRKMDRQMYERSHLSFVYPCIAITTVNH